MTAAADTATVSLPDGLGSAAREFLARPRRLLIGSERPEAADGRTFATLDPATGREIADVAHAGKEDVDRAVLAAREAFSDGPWASLPASTACFSTARARDRLSEIKTRPRSRMRSSRSTRTPA